MYTDTIVTDHETNTTAEVFGTSRLTASEIVEAVQATGSHFFDADTMRWFGTRRNSLTMHGVYMIGKDGKAPEGCEPYWVRSFGTDGQVITHGKRFTRAGALGLVKRLREGITV